MAESNEDDPSLRVVEQGVRNRIIEYLEAVRDAAPLEWPGSFSEYFNSFYDWVPEATSLNVRFATGAMSGGELDALETFRTTFNEECESTPDDMDYAVFLASRAHARIRAAAIEMLSVFARRGRLSEEIEEWV
jgi:hypothetical protein